MLQEGCALVEAALDGACARRADGVHVAAVDQRAVVVALVLRHDGAEEVAEARLGEHPGAEGRGLDIGHEVVQENRVPRDVAVGVGLEEVGLASVEGGEAAGELGVRGRVGKDGLGQAGVGRGAERLGGAHRRGVRPCRLGVDAESRRHGDERRDE